MAESQSSGFDLGEGLVVKFVDITELKEQEINAQVMNSRHFERLTENIRERGQLESLPYCYQPNGQGPVEIVSGHHRARAARAAGMKSIPVLIDTVEMPTSKKIARQIAANELHGSSDPEVLATLVAMIDSVDALLMTGLDESMLPTIADNDAAKLDLPRAEFEWRMLPLMFLPAQVDDFKLALDSIDKDAALLGYGGTVEDFAAFAKAVHNYGRAIEVRNLSTTVAVMTRIAAAELSDRAATLGSKESKDGRARVDDEGVKMMATVDVMPRVLPAPIAMKLKRLFEASPELTPAAILDRILDEEISARKAMEADRG